MARRSTAAAATAETEVKPVVRRRRRRTTVDHAAQTAILVNALLKSRGESGAAQSAIISVIEWARNVHEEDAAMRQLKTRPRRAKAEISGERVAKFDVNKALLDGVLAGQVGINIDEDGNIVFLAV